MKHSLIILIAVAVSGCATFSAPTAPSAVDGAPLARLAGEYDNHAQVWRAHQDNAASVPPHVHHLVVAVPGVADAWDWTLRAERDGASTLEATWRYTARRLDDGRLMLTPQRSLPSDAGEPRYAALAPCALVGGMDGAALVLAADVAACSAILPGLGADAALLPLRLRLDGDRLDVAGFIDQPRGESAVEQAERVRWFGGWSAINGAGPDARADSSDWHLKQELRVHDQGGEITIPWRDGAPSGYSIKLEQLDYRERATRVLKLSIVREDGGVVAYAWADPRASQVGINLGWLQVGLQAEDGTR